MNRARKVPSLMGSVLPKVCEPVWRQLGISDCVLDGAVPEISLD